MQAKTVTVPTLKRLPIYLTYLKHLQEQGREVVSTTHLSRVLKQDPTQIRKDLAATGLVGKPKVGFDVSKTIEHLENFLGYHNTNDAFLVGVGNLGRAIMGYLPFVEKGLNIVAAFDNNPELIGKEIAGIPVLTVEKLTDLAKRMKIKLGILTVPESVAQDLTDAMVEGGIQVIWNFVPTRLMVPDSVYVEYTQLSSHLAVIKKKLQSIK